MNWQQLELITTADYADMFAELLSAAGAVAVGFHDAADQPILEPDFNSQPLWDKTKVEGLFSETANLDDLMFEISTMGPTIVFSCAVKIIEEEDWVRLTQANFQPKKFGERLWVYPSWDAATPADAVTVLLDPGVAFGTGSHATTALCLEWLDRHIQMGDLVLDYGCGSGILAIAALKLGASQVWAIDHDPQALQATRDNANRNDVTEAQLIVTTPDQLPPWQPDVLIANILAEPLINLAATFATLLQPTGKLILSGILEEQIETVVRAYRPWFRSVAIAKEEEWIRLEFEFANH